MKTIGMVDAVRANMTFLPKGTPEETSHYLADLPISENLPWILQEYVKGSEYCTHSVVVKGKVRVFVACPSAELLMHYEALPLSCGLSQAMYDFTAAVAKTGGEQFTGHLSFDFMVPDPGQGIPLTALPKNKIQLYPIECNPRAHTAVALFNGVSQMSDAYMAALMTRDDLADAEFASVDMSKKEKYYWIGHDLITRLILPTMSFLMLGNTPSVLLRKYKEFFTHLFFWKDGTFEVWDPLP